MAAAPIDTDLERLAGIHGVETQYKDWQGRQVTVDPDVVVAVLAMLDVDAGSSQSIRAALRAVPPRVARVDVVSPALLVPPPVWGWMLQVYALRSGASWDVGDLADTAAFTRWAAGTGAGAILLSPLHAVLPTDPIQASPYSPSSRRFLNPLFLRVENTREYLLADPDLRSRVDTLRPRVDADLIDTDRAWLAKKAALELLWTEQPGPVSAGLLPQSPREGGNTRPSPGTVAKDVAVADGAAGARDEAALRSFAVYNALAERHGGDWRSWPAPLRNPHGAAVAAQRDDLADRVAFHTWLQRCCDAQLAAVHDAAAGMTIGVVHDLAVGIDPGGADAWMLQDVIAQGVRIGAPPDAFSQQGQDWAVAPWRPDRLAATGYAAFRDLVRSTLRHADGLRFDHVAALSRLWWLPPGATAGQGTYVRYDADTMLRILAEEAVRAGAVVIGEDLGTVEPEVRHALRARNMLSSAVLFMSRDSAGRLASPDSWPELAVGSISTHDLPTAAGFLRGEHVRAAALAGTLRRGERAEAVAADGDRRRLITLLEAEGLIGRHPTDEEIVVALHRLLTGAPCRVVLASPYDVLGEVRQPNLPGTVDEYPNWRIPLPVRLDELFTDARVRRVVDILTACRPQPGRANGDCHEPAPTAFGPDHIRL